MQTSESVVEANRVLMIFRREHTLKAILYFLAWTIATSRRRYPYFVFAEKAGQIYRLGVIAVFREPSLFKYSHVYTWVFPPLIRDPPPHPQALCPGLV